MPLRYGNITLESILTKEKVPRRSKIVATIGQNYTDVELLKKLVLAGVNIFRLNMSHGSIAEKKEAIDNINKVREDLGPSHIVAILLDTKGPEIRTGKLVDKKSIDIVRGEMIKFVTKNYVDHLGTPGEIAVSYPKLAQSVKKGDIILAADGSLEFKVEEIYEDEGAVLVECQNDGSLGQTKNMNLPGNVVDLPILTEGDAEAIELLSPEVDFIAASFIQNADNYSEIKQYCGENNVHIIAKIENQEGLKNFDDIASTFDGIMVARGDLGMEIPTEKVFMAQKYMIRRCNLIGKPIITATQLLESMINNPRPTRAEATDVANAVIDGSDAVMLSGETANGKFPVRAVETMAAICVQAESIFNNEEFHNLLLNSNKDELFHTKRHILDVHESFASNAVKTQIDSDLKLVLILSDKPQTVQYVSKYKPSCLTLFVTDDAKFATQMNGVRQSVKSLYVEDLDDDNVDGLIQKGVDFASDLGYVKAGQEFVVLKVFAGEESLQTRTV